MRASSKKNLPSLAPIVDSPPWGDVLDSIRKTYYQGRLFVVPVDRVENVRSGAAEPAAPEEPVEYASVRVKRRRRLQVQ